MGATYTRQSSTEIVDGEVINAADFNNEFAQLVSAFAVSTGHTHDGTTAEGGPVTKLLGTAITIGDGSSGTDIAVTFDGETSDGLLTWMEDEDHFKFSDDVVIDSTKRLYVFDEGGEYISGDGTDITVTSGADINLTATSDVNIPANVGVTFGNDGEKIEGDGTDLTISGNNINLTATADVVIPADVGITFGTGEKIEGNSTDLTVTSGADINLTATSDVNIPANVGITFGDDGEKIEGDGTDLTISGNNINLTATADVNIPSGVGVTFATAEKIESDGTDLSITVGSGGDINVPANIGVTFGDDGEKIEGDGTDLTINASADLNLTATTDINIPANVGLTFGDDAEKIEGDGTDLTVSGNNINLTATADVNIPSGVGLTFATAEKIESDGTDLSITVGSGGDINIPANIGVTFGDDGEKIEGDGTDLTISSSAILTIDAGADIVLDAGGANVTFKDDGTAIGDFSNSSSDFVITSSVQDKDIVFKGDDGGSAVTALTLDMSDAGAATFNNAITSGAVITSGAGLVIANAGNIGSASDTDAIAIASNGVVTFSQVPVLPNDTIETADIQDNAVTLAKMAGLARGKLIIGDASGDPSALAAGSANYVLTSDGTDIAWAAASSSADPSSADGDSLGTASAEWSDLYLADGGIIYFGNDQDVTVTHDPDDGLFLKSIATGDDNPFLLTLQTGETDIAANDVIGKVAFQAPDEGTGTDAILVAAAIQARSEGDFASDANATSIDFMTGASEAAATKWSITSAGTFLNAGTNKIDMNAGELILDADADTSITADTDDQIDIRIAGADDFQFTANTFTAQSGSTITTPTLGVGATKDLGSGIHIKTADSGASVNADEDELVIEGSGNVGMALLGGTSSTASVVFGDSSVGRSGRILYHMGDDYMDFGVNTAGGGATSKLYLSSRGAFVGDVTNGKQGTGMTLNQGANDDEILALKSSDIAHGMTSVGETDTFASFQKNDNGVRGGLVILGMAESDYTGPGIELSGYAEATDTASSTSATAVTGVRASKTSGTGGAAVSSNANVFRIVASGNTQWICDAEGDTKYNGTDGAGAFDDWDDVELLTTARHVTVTDKKFAKQMFGNFVQENAEVLDKYGVITLNDDGHHFVSTKGLNALVIDAIRQTRNIQKAFYNILSDEQKNKFAGEIEEMKLPVLPAFQTP